MSRVYIVYECTNNPENLSTTIHSYIAAFIDENKMLQYIEEKYKDIIQQWKDLNISKIEKIYDDPDCYVIYGKDDKGNTHYYEIRYEGNIPVIFDYDNDWFGLNNKEDLPKRTIPDTIYLVNQDMEVIGGCLPDLPDSAYVNIEDAYKRIDYLFECTKGGWSTDMNITVTKDEQNNKSLEGSEHFYFRTYISGKVNVIK